MKSKWIWNLGKFLEFLGLIVVAVGVFTSVRLGMEDEGLASMGAEFRALGVGGGLFLAGWLIERMATKG